MSLNPYGRLGLEVPPLARLAESDARVVREYRRLARWHYSRRQPGDKREAEEFVCIAQAYHEIRTQRKAGRVLMLVTTEVGKVGGGVESRTTDWRWVDTRP